MLYFIEESCLHCGQDIGYMEIGHVSNDGEFIVEVNHRKGIVDKKTLIDYLYSHKDSITMFNEESDYYNLDEMIDIILEVKNGV